MGLRPHEQGKLKAIKGALIIGENFGLALDPSPTIIPFHQVSKQLAKVKEMNGGKPARIIRNGMLIKIRKNPPRSAQDYTGIWRVTSIKNNKGTILLDLIRPSYVTPKNGVSWAGMNKTLQPLLDGGLEIVGNSYSKNPDLS